MEAPGNLGFKDGHNQGLSQKATLEPGGRLVEFIEDWHYFVERDGLRRSLPQILSEILMLPYRHLRFLILAHDLHDPVPEWKPKAQYEIRLFSKSDLEWVRQIDRPSEARHCALRLEQGHVGFVALKGGSLAGYTWGSTDLQTRMERVHPQLEAGDFLCTDSYTAHEYRGSGVQTGLTVARFNHFRELGYSRAVSTIDVHNKPSLAVWQRKLNSQTIGTIDFLRVGSFYRVRYQCVVST